MISMVVVFFNGEKIVLSYSDSTGMYLLYAVVLTTPIEVEKKLFHMQAIFANLFQNWHSWAIKKSPVFFPTQDLLVVGRL